MKERGDNGKNESQDEYRDLGNRRERQLVYKKNISCMQGGDGNKDHWDS